VNKNIWEIMQKKAEEKRKGYCCVVWLEKKIEKKEFLEIFKKIENSVDDDGQKCLQVFNLYFYFVFFFIFFYFIRSFSRNLMILILNYCYKILIEK
jgi:hypothetical protein